VLDAPPGRVYTGQHEDLDREAGIRAGPDCPGCLRGPVFGSGGRPARLGRRSPGVGEAV